MPSLSLLIPSSDRPRELGRLLASLAASRGVDLSTVEVRVAWHATSPAARASYPRLLEHPPLPVTARRMPAREGPAAFRNALAAEAAAPLLLFLDDDTTAHPRLIAETLAHADRTRDDLWGGVSFTFPPPGASPAFARLLSRLDTTWRTPALDGEGRVAAIPGLQFAIRRSAFAALAGFDPHLRVAEDTDLCRRARLAGFRLGENPAQIVHHRGPGTVTALLSRFFRYGVGNGRLDRRPGLPPARPGRALLRLGRSLDPREPAASALDAARLLAYWGGRIWGRLSPG